MLAGASPDRLMTQAKTSSASTEKDADPRRLESLGVALANLSLLSPWGLFGLSVVLGVALRFLVNDSPVNLTSDYWNHHHLAVALSQGDLLPGLFYKGPGTAAAYSVGFWLLGGSDYIHWLTWNCLVLFPLASLAAFLVSRALLGHRRLAALSPALLAIAPSFVFVAHLVATENVAPIGILLALWGWLRAHERRTFFRAAIAGALFGLSLFLKPVLLPLTPAFIVGLALRRVEGKLLPRLYLGERWRNAWLALSFVAAACITIAPWQLTASQHFGRFLPTVAAYGPLVYFSSNSPYGDAAYPVAIKKRFDLVPELTAEDDAAWRWNKLQRYSWWYVAHNPKSLLRDLPFNARGQFLYGGEIAGDVLRNIEGHPEKYRDRAIHSLVFFAMLLGGLLGLLSAPFSAASGRAAAIKALWLYGMVAVPFLLFTGQERHRMLFLPLNMILASTYAAAISELDREKWWQRSLGPLVKTAEQAAHALTTIWQRLASLGRPRLNRATRLGLLVAAGLLLLVVRMGSKITLDAGDVTGGNASVINTLPLASPHQVFGNLVCDGSSSFKTEFKFDSARAGMHELQAVYSASPAHPLDVIVNKRRALTGVFHEGFGSAANDFARQRSLGRIHLNEGRNAIVLQSSEDPSRLPEAFSQRTVIPIPIRIARREGKVGLPDINILSKEPGRFAAEIEDLPADNPLILESAVIDLSPILAGGSEYELLLPLLYRGAPTWKVWITGYDENDAPEVLRKVIPVGQYKEFVMPQQFPMRYEFKPSASFHQVRIRIDVWGDGWMRLCGPVVLQPVDYADNYYGGPFIEELSLQPVGQK